MKKTRIAIATICLLLTTMATVSTSKAATIFAGAIVSIDQIQQTITFQTKTGQIWTIPVADSDILKQQIAKGDRVRVDVELSESDFSKRITKIIKIGKDEPFEPPSSLDVHRP